MRTVHTYAPSQQQQQQQQQPTSSSSSSSSSSATNQQNLHQHSSMSGKVFKVHLFVFSFSNEEQKRK
jgi:biotin carboxyl carrier protein